MISRKKISGFADLKFLKGIKKKREKREVSAFKVLLFSHFIK